jgi:hypothetical protein
MIPVKNATTLELHLQNKGASKIAVEVIRSVFQNMMQEYHMAWHYWEFGTSILDML